MNKKERKHGLVEKVKKVFKPHVYAIGDELKDRLRGDTYRVSTVYDNGRVEITDIDGDSTVIDAKQLRKATVLLGYQGRGSKEAAAARRAEVLAGQIYAFDEVGKEAFLRAVGPKLTAWAVNKAKGGPSKRGRKREEAA